MKRRKPQKQNPKSLANLRPWKPGQSGNPGGRPKHDVSSELAQYIFSTIEPQEFARIRAGFVKQLKKGNSKVFTALADRAYGKAPQHISLSGKDGGAIPHTVEGIDEALRKLLDVAEERKETGFKEEEFGNRNRGEFTN